MPGMEKANRDRGELDEERRRALHASFNRRISYLCKLAALVIAVVAFGPAIAVGQDAPRRSCILGLCVSVALLAIAIAAGPLPAQTVIPKVQRGSTRA